MISSHLRPLFLFLLAVLGWQGAGLRAAEVVADFAGPDSVPVVADGYKAAGDTVKISLGFVPSTGTELKVVDNTGLALIEGTLGNLAQGQAVGLVYEGISYPFVADYYGGDGNDLVLRWGRVKAYGWGYNNLGQMGDGNLVNRLAPVAVSDSGVLAGKTLLQVAQGSHHTLALCADGSLVGWGSGLSGGLGNGSTADSFSTPVNVNMSGVLAGKRVVAVAGGWSCSFAVCSDGTVASWGNNNDGQLGNGTTGSISVPGMVVHNGFLSGRKVVRLAAGSTQILALCSDGTLASWGTNTHGQLGNNSTTMSRVPVGVVMNGALAGKKIVAIRAGDASCYVLCDDGSIAAWGYNVLPVAGGDGSLNSKVPVIVGNAGVLTGKAAKMVDAGSMHVMAVAADGSLAAWGTNGYGELGNNTVTASGTPVAVQTSGVLKGKILKSIRARSSHSLALCTDGTVAAWGYNTYGQLGTGDQNDTRVPVAVSRGALAPGEVVVHLASGALSRHSAVLAALPLSTNSALAGLVPSVGTLNPAFSSGVTDYVLRMPQGTASVTLRPTVADASATVTVNGEAVASGANSGAIAYPSAPVEVVVTAQDGSRTTYRVRLEGDSSLSGLVVPGAVLLPGFNRNVTAYQAHVSPETTEVSLTAVLSDPSGTMTVDGVVTASGTASAPVALVPGPNVIPVVGTAADGASTRYEVTVVRQVPLAASFGAAGAVAVRAAAYVATANRVELSLGYAPATGTPLTVVDNTGTGQITGRFTNLAHGQRVNLVFGRATYSYIANYHGGDGNDLVLLWANSRMWGWGYNAYGQLGDGSTTRALLPVPVNGGGVLAGRTLNRVSAGAQHAVALCVDGTVVSWGRSNYGQLGNGGTTDSAVAVRVTTTGALAGKTVIDVTAGMYHSLALCSDGTVVAWGNNDYGQLGTGNTTGANAPVAVLRSGALAGKQVIAIGAGGYNSIVLCADGTVATWGNNVAGQIGDGTNATRNAPVDVTRNGALANRTVRAVDTGGHSLVLCTDGSLVAWGTNDNGQLGVGSTNRLNTPTAVTVTAALAGKTIVGIDTANEQSFAWCSDGTVAAWGDNSYGALVDGTSTDRNTPVAVAKTGGLAGKSVASVAAGWGHTLFLNADGTLAAGGYNSDGQLGDNSTTNRFGAVAVNLSGLTEGERPLAVFSGPVASQSFMLTALPLSGNFRLSGLVVGGAKLVPGFAAATTSYVAQVAAGVDSVTVTPVAADAGATIRVNGVVQASGSTSAAIALSPDLVIEIEVLAANGTSTVYQVLPRRDSTLVGLGASAGVLEPVFASAITRYVDYVSPGTESIVLTPTAGDAAARIEVAGLEVASGAASAPVALNPGENPVVVKVTATDGSSTSYEVRVIRQVPVRHVFGPSALVAHTANGYTATRNLTELSLGFAPQPGAVLTVVDNTGSEPVSGRFADLAQGQVLVLPFGQARYPFVVDYFGGDGNDVVLRWAKNRLYAWGYNNNGQLGTGNTTNLTSPAPVTASGVLAGKVIRDVANGDAFTLALCTDGSLVSWGANASGQLGNGGTSNSNVPVGVNRSGVLAGKEVIAIAAGGVHCLVLCSDGTLATWGRGQSGTLGNGGSTNSSVPVLVRTDGVLAGRRPVAIAAGGGHNLVLCADGALVTWGWGSSGQLGNGFNSDSLVPVQVVANGWLANKKVVGIAAGSDHNLAVCADGTVAAWGSNSNGRLGNGNTTQANVPVGVTMTGVLAGRKVIRAAAGYTQSLVLCADGTLASWGSGTYGQLGQGSNSSSNTPVLVNRSGVLAGKTVTRLAAGGAHHHVLCSDGTLATWGYNSIGQLGNGTYTNSNVPVLAVTAGVGAGERFFGLAGSSGANHGTVIAGMPLGTNSRLAALSLASGTTVPAFDPAVTDYTLKMPEGVTSLTVVPTAADPGALITVNGTVVASGTASPPVSTANAAPVTIVVTAENGAATTYVLTAKSDSSLSGLTLSAGTLSPAFAGSVTTYDVVVGASTGSVSLTPVASDPSAVIDVNGTPVVSGSASAPVALVAGVNAVNVRVTASDGTATTYVVRVERIAPMVHHFNSATSVAVTRNGYVASGDAAFTLGFSPPNGTQLTVVNHTGTSFIQGRFANLAQGQRITLAYGARTYDFIVNYYGGNGNDLVLQWANVRLAGAGRNQNGELGALTPQYSLVPRPMADGGAMAGRVPLSISGGLQHTLALCADGTIAAWGVNGSGQLGDNSTQTRWTPVAVSRTGVLSNKTIIAVAAGGSHSVAVADDGTVAAWGGNTLGQLGNASTTASAVPVAVNRAGVLKGRQVMAVAAGGSHTLALCDDGTLVAWGANNEGQLGNGGVASGGMPVAVSQGGVLAGKTVVAIAAGIGHSVALCSDGTLAAWGGNTYGELGDNSGAQKTTPVLVDRSGVLAGKTVVAISCGGRHTLARCSDGTLAAWGFGQQGQLGNNSTSYATSAPVAVLRSGVLAGKTTAVLASGENHSMAVNTDGTMATWGENIMGALGDNTSYDRNAPVSVVTSQLVAGERFVSVVGGADYIMALVAGPPGPVVATGVATGVDDTRATVTGTVNANAIASTVWVEYGRTDGYGQIVAATPAAVSGTAATPVTAILTDLTPGVLWHYRVVARTATGLVAGANQTFTTTAAAGLSGLAVDAGVLSPAFAPDTAQYRMTVPFATTAVVLTPVAAAVDSTITVNGTPVASGAASQAVPLAVGSNAIPVVVTAAGGSTRSYRLTVLRMPESFYFGAATAVPVSVDGFVASGAAPPVSLGFAPVSGSAEGSRLTLVNNAGILPIEGRFSNLAQGQRVEISYAGGIHPYVVDYFGGDGNDLVLQWANTRVASWGVSSAGEFGNGATTVSYTPVAADTSGVLAGKAVLRMAAVRPPLGGYSPNNNSVVAVLSDGTLASWGGNEYGQLGNGTTARSTVPVAVTRDGVLAGKMVVAVSAGGAHVLALCADGTLVAWGRNADGQLGDGSTTDRKVPVLVSRNGVLAGRRVVAIAAGTNHSVVLCADGTLAAWGTGQVGQLGNPGVVSSTEPVEVLRVGALENAEPVAVAAGLFSSHVVCADGSVVSWGRNVGVADLRESAIPVRALQSGVLSGKKVVSLAALVDHCIAVCSDGTMAAWGTGNYGQLGNNTTGSSEVPVTVARTGALAGKTPASAAVANGYSMVVCTDGTMATFGNNLNGQLGDNTSTTRTVPVQVVAGALQGNKYFVAAAGRETTTHALYVVPVPAAETLAATSIGGTGATLNGRVNAKGGVATTAFQYGLDKTYGSTVAAMPASVSGTTPVAVSAVLSGLKPGTTYHYRAVASGEGGGAQGADMSFTTLSDNAWLADLALDEGELNPEFARETAEYRTTVPFSSAQVTVSAPTAHPGAVVRYNGSLSPAVNLVVGANLIEVKVTAEDGITTQSWRIRVHRLPQSFHFASAGDVPVRAAEFDTGGYPVDITLGYAPSPGTILTMVDLTGSRLTGGRFGNLAQGQRVLLAHGGRTYPFVIDYRGGTGNDLVLRWADTALAAWGAGGFGQLGNGRSESGFRPVTVDAGGILANRVVTRVAAGYLHSVALCADGTLAAWGANSQGQLGNGGDAPAASPAALASGVLDGRTVVAVAAGAFHSLSLCDDGTVAAWGYNNHGQLGDGTRTNRRMPVAVNFGSLPAGATVVGIAAGAYQSFAWTDSGMLYGWGYNDEGQLGNGTTTGSALPVEIGRGGVLAGKVVVDVAAGQYHTLALCSDGTLVSWGYNRHGQLGDGSVNDASTPVAIGNQGALAGRVPQAIHAGAHHSLAWCTDGSLVAWGLNDRGQLGIAGGGNRLVPTAVDLTTLGGSTGLAMAAAGANHNLWVRSGGDLFAWGANADGQLGVGGVVSRPELAAVSGLTGPVMAVASGPAANHALALVAGAGFAGAAPTEAAAWVQGTAGLAEGDAATALLRRAFALDAALPVESQLPVGKAEGDEFVVRFTRPPGTEDILYQAEWSESLEAGEWHELPNRGGEDDLRFAIPLEAGGRGFIRLKVRQR